MTTADSRMTDMLESPESLTDYARAAFREALTARHDAPTAAAALRGLLAMALVNHEREEERDGIALLADDDECDEDCPGPPLTDLLCTGCSECTITAEKVQPEPDKGESFTDLLHRGSLGHFDMSAWRLPRFEPVRLPFPPVLDFEFPRVEVPTEPEPEPDRTNDLGGVPVTLHEGLPPVLSVLMPAGTPPDVIERVVNATRDAYFGTEGGPADDEDEVGEWVTGTIIGMGEQHLWRLPDGRMFPSTDCHGEDVSGYMKDVRPLRPEVPKGHVTVDAEDLRFTLRAAREWWWRGTPLTPEVIDRDMRVAAVLNAHDKAEQGTTKKV